MKLPVVVLIAVGAAGSVPLRAQGTQEADAVKVYSVCEVLENLESLSGKIISVRGTVSGGQGTFLAGRCRSKLIVKRYRWPDLIWLTFPRDDTPFGADLEAYNRVWETVKRLRPREGDEVVITCVGMIETKDLTKVTGVNIRGKPVGIGFGAGNLAPAQLVVKTEMDPRVVRRQH